MLRPPRVIALFRDLASSSERRDFARYRLAEALAGVVYPKYPLSAYGRRWLRDADFWRFYTRYVGIDTHEAERKYCLSNLLHLADDVEGDTAEAGVYKGASSYLICRHI